MSECKHTTMDAHVEVDRFEDSTTWYAEVHVRCADCGMVAQFFGLPGISPAGPTVTVCGNSANLPFKVALPPFAWKWDGEKEIPEADREAIGRAIQETVPDADA